MSAPADEFTDANGITWQVVRVRQEDGKRSIFADALLEVWQAHDGKDRSHWRRLYPNHFNMPKDLYDLLRPGAEARTAEKIARARGGAA